MIATVSFHTSCIHCPGTQGIVKCESNNDRRADGIGRVEVTVQARVTGLDALWVVTLKDEPPTIKGRTAES